MADQPKFWLNRYPILDEDHIPGIEAQAAVHEFKNKLPREEAEGKAHEDYVKERALESGAWHLLGMQSAHAVGSMETARQHGAAYVRALEHLGFEPYGPPPKELGDAVKAISHNYAKFKGHDSDVFFEPDEAEGTEAEGKEKAPSPIKTSMDRIKALKEAVAKSREKQEKTD